MAPTAQTTRKRWPAALARALTTPFDIDDYLELVNPLWSSRGIRARVSEVRRETADATTLVLTPNANWPGHRAGQHVQLGVEIEGVRQQRTFSVSSAPGEPLTLTIKRNGDGLVSNCVVDQLTTGAILYLSEPAGEFVLPEPLPGKLLMVAGGSGITPLHAMLRTLHQQGWQGDIQLLYYNRDADAAIFDRELRRLADQWPAFTYTPLFTGRGERFSPAQLAEQVPDFRERETFLCGPAGLMEQVEALYRQEGLETSLHQERFSAPARSASADGGRARFALSGAEAVGTGTESVLELAEATGLQPKHGCRMGICHTCTCRLNSGRLRNLQNGELFEAEGEHVRICIHAPEGDVDLDL